MALVPRTSFGIFYERVVFLGLFSKVYLLSYFRIASSQKLIFNFQQLSLSGSFHSLLSYALSVAIRASKTTLWANFTCFVIHDHPKVNCFNCDVFWWLVPIGWITLGPMWNLWALRCHQCSIFNGAAAAASHRHKCKHLAGSIEPLKIVNPLLCKFRYCK